MRKSILAFATLASLLACANVTIAAEKADIVVTLLGSGTPDPRVDRFGPSTLVEAGGKALVFDAGRGVVQRLQQTGVSLGEVGPIFFTHYHSDHTVGLPDLWLIPWLPPHGARKHPLTLIGPTGIKQLAEGLQSAYRADQAIREEDEKLDPKGSQLIVQEHTTPGVVFDSGGVRVTAFEVEHGAHIKPSWGYKVEFNGRSVVITGDTRKVQSVIDQGKNADVIVHEVALATPSLAGSEAIKRIMAHHTSPEEAGEVFSAAKPKLAVYTHLVLLHPKGEQEPTTDEIERLTRKTYSGPLVVGQDLMRISIGDQVTVDTKLGG